MSNNPFRRYAFTPYDPTVHGVAPEQTVENNVVPYAGGDLHAYVNNIKIGNLESITISVNTETVGNYVMGRRDPVTHTQGKKITVGSMVLSQWKRDALLEEVFKLSQLKIKTLSDFWDPTTRRAAKIGTQGTTPVTVPRGYNTYNTIGHDNNALNSAAGDFSNSFKGLPAQEIQAQLREQVESAVRMVGSRKITSPDQLPPFDITLVGVSKMGEVSRCAIRGIQISQVTMGWSMNDMGNAVGFSFYAQGYTPWMPVDTSNQGQFILPDLA